MRCNHSMAYRKEVKKECGTTDCDSITTPQFIPKKPMVLNQNLFAKKKIEYFAAILMKYGHSNSCPYPVCANAQFPLSNESLKGRCKIGKDRAF